MQAGMLRLAARRSLSTISGVSTAGLKASLAGYWTNKLGSHMRITVNDSGFITGRYKSKVSASGEVARGDIVGYQQDITQPTFGFVVKWATAPADSVTVWAGQYYNGGGKEQLKTMWLLREHDPAANDNWDATLVGMDVFTRAVPAECEDLDDRSEL
ncbi:avidin-like [Scyliorhinus canicula]|uniref:avidin-like n=1 Tax=Scyliorhinus canicula TaxID=7830 RepID=UPI0018F70B77|nr:avidin-like [Scyliorhinus canicula]